MNIEITERAKKEIANILKNEEKGSFFRVTIEGGGCSGFKYIFSIDKTINIDDFKNDMVVIDKLSLNYLKNSILDYQETLIEKAFKIKNPNAQSSCGCGISFSL
tara:strand:+ start:165 stop:476 length:312 start_codon:yes stop_codon:yes gene_type:complete